MPTSVEGRVVPTSTGGGGSLWCPPLPEERGSLWSIPLPGLGGHLWCPPLPKGGTVFVPIFVEWGRFLVPTSAGGGERAKINKEFSYQRAEKIPDG